MPRRLEDEYTIQEALGSGSYAEVFRCTHKKTQEQYAVKVINKQKAGSKGVATTQNEVDILRSLNHHNVIFVKDSFESSSSIYIVLEIVSGGELFDKIVELKHYSETLAAKLIRHILETLKYLHSQGIAHRDLKPENLLLKQRIEGAAEGAADEGERERREREDLLTGIKLVDFGFAVRFKPGSHTMTECCGTPNFIAPEILQLGVFKSYHHPAYDEKCDIWSTGVLAYILLCGYPPFHAPSRNDMFKKIVAGKIIFHKKTVWEKISADAKDFVNALLVTDPDKRLSAEEALQHPWMQASAEEEAKRDGHMEEALEELKNFKARQKLKAGIFGLEAAHRMMYMMKCKDLSIKPNSALMKQLEKDDLTEMDLSNNYLGTKGLAAALKSIEESATVTTIQLQDNQIDNAGVATIVESLKAHPTVTSVNLGNNPISQLAGRSLLSLLQTNHNIAEMNLAGTYIKPTFLQKIEAQLVRNKAKL